MVIASDLSRQNGRQWRDTATDASNNRLSEVISIATLYFFHAGSTFSGPWPVISKWQNDSWEKIMSHIQGSCMHVIIELQVDVDCVC